MDSHRSIRVFVSSTFCDMQAERDELVKRVFPRLRRLCAERHVGWTEVDLRWGITTEDAAEGKVLPICLEEIHRCRPYFIGLLGERYGWIPTEMPEDLVERQPWLAEHRHKSVTELEILHGVLNDPAMAQRSYFYFRDPAYVDSVPPGERAAYLEAATSEEIRKLGPEEAARRGDDRRRRLRELKDRVRKSGLPLREGYTSPRQLGDLVLADLASVIESLDPAAAIPDPLDREAAEHEAFAESRREIYLAREGDLAHLDAHVSGDRDPLVVLGEAGSGKSALLANWLARFRERHPETPAVVHFVGATPSSTNWRGMLRRLLGEFNRIFDVGQEIPDEAHALRLAFANALHRVAAKGRMVLVLDGLNQLEDREQALDLAWLPPRIPAGVRLLLSTLPGKPLGELRRRGWPTVTVGPLTQRERERLVERYLREKHGKRLSEARVEEIASAEQTANPLYLRTLLEELRVFGVHERLDERIGHYLEADTTADLYEKVLARWEEDYEGNRRGLVGEAMSLVWAARRGLREGELLDLLGRDGLPLPQAAWSPLHLAAWESLVSRSGFLGFSHADLRAAVEARYLAPPEAQRAAHLRLADYYDGRRLEPRSVDELPWQLREADSWQRLYGLLGDLEFFDRAWSGSEFEVRANWAAIETHSALRLEGAYDSVVEDPAWHESDRVYALEMLLGDMGHLKEAAALCGHLVTRFRQLGDAAGLGRSLGNQAAILYAKGDLGGAMALWKEQERISRELGDHPGLQASLGNQAVILEHTGDLDRAMALMGEQERICRELGDPEGVQRSLGNQAAILRAKGDLDGAMALHKAKERICRELGRPAGLAMSLGNQALIRQDRGDLDGAMALNKEEERICRELGDRAGLQRSLGKQATILYARGDLHGAMALAKEQERICGDLGNPVGLQTSLGTQALIQNARGDSDGALSLAKEQERICRELGDLALLQRSLGNHAVILWARGDLDGALALLKEQERICRELGDRAGLQASLGNQGGILQVRGDLEGAMALHKEEERICSELGDLAGLQVSLGNQALILQAKGDLDRAMALHKEKERICRELGDLAELAASLANQAVILWRDESRRDAARLLIAESYRLARSHGLAPLASRIQSILNEMN